MLSISGQGKLKMLKLSDIIVLFIIIGCVSGVAFYAGYKYASDDLNAVQSELEIVKLENEEQRKHHVEVQNETETKWKDVVAQYDARAPIRVRTNCGAREVPAPGGTAGQYQNATGKPGLGSGFDAAREVQGYFAPVNPVVEISPLEIDVERCEQIANRAVKDAAQVLWMLDFDFNTAREVSK